VKKKPINSRAKLTIKRVYEPADDSDGFRVLVDRLWPRGLTREAARVDLWLKDLAPSDELRHRFHAAPEKFKEFRTAYEKELAQAPAREAVETLRGHLARGGVTLLFAARDDKQNNAVVLLDWLISPRVIAKKKEPRAKRSSKTQ
jgi:uncharacterized protein YeaO (DUF488 family)